MSITPLKVSSLVAALYVPVTSRTLVVMLSVQISTYLCFLLSYPVRPIPSYGCPMKVPLTCCLTKRPPLTSAFSAVPSVVWGSPGPIHIFVTVFHVPTNFLRISCWGPGVPSLITSCISCSSVILTGAPALDFAAARGEARVAPEIRQQPSRPQRKRRHRVHVHFDMSGSF